MCYAYKMLINSCLVVVFKKQSIKGIQISKLEKTSFAIYSVYKLYSIVLKANMVIYHNIE